MRFWKRLFGIRRSLYLGNITVTSSFSLKKGISKLNPPKFPVDPGLIEQTLREVMALSPVSSRAPANKSDLAIDITVSDFDMGEFMLFSALGFTIPFAWRPDIAMTAHVYQIDSGTTIFAHTVKQKLEWKVWLRKIRSPQALLRIKAFMDPDDVRYLVRKASLTLLKRVQDAI